MVIFLILALFFSQTLPAITVHLPPKVSVSVDGQVGYELQPIPCSLTIIRDPTQKVDITSFSYHDKPLQVQFISDTRAGPQQLFKGHEQDEIIVSTYRFTLLPQNKGLYVIDPVSVKVGDVIVTSNPFTYEVVGPQVNTSLTLNAALLTTGTIYPGQKVQFQYKITFHDMVQLTKENLPLLELDNFRNVKAAKVETFAEGGATVQLITQDAIALKPGTLTAPESLIEGHIFTQDASGSKTINPQIFQATAPGFTITVTPFPEQDQPGSFSGAIGLFHYELRPLTQAIQANERMHVELIVSGQGDLGTVNISPSSLKKQLSPSFEVSDLPPVGKIENASKHFILELIPLSVGIKAIPPLEFTSFYPALNRYYTVKTRPIPIVVTATAKKPSLSQPRIAPQAVEIFSNVSLNKIVSPISFSTTTLVLALFLTALLFFIEKKAYVLWQESQKQQDTSHDLFMQALTNKNDMKIAFPLIRQALLLRLYEIKETKEPVLNPQDLQSYGIQEEIKKFLCSLDEKSFGGLAEHVEVKEIIDQATELYYRLRS